MRNCSLLKFSTYAAYSLLLTRSSFYPIALKLYLPIIKMSHTRILIHIIKNWVYAIVRSVVHFCSSRSQLQIKMYPHTLTQLDRWNPFSTPFSGMHQNEQPVQGAPEEAHPKRKLPSVDYDSMYNTKITL